MAKQYHILILTLLLTSCATASPISLSDTKALPQGEALIFGRVRVIENEESIDWGSGGAFRIHLLADAGAKPVSYHLTGDGSFSWHLPPGRYSITGFQRSERSMGSSLTHRRQLFAQFTVPEQRALVYIGTLVISLDEGDNGMGIEDEHEEAIRWLRGKFGEIAGEDTESLMHQEKAR